MTRRLYNYQSHNLTFLNAKALKLNFTKTYIKVIQKQSCLLCLKVIFVGDDCMINS